MTGTLLRAVAPSTTVGSLPELLAARVRLTPSAEAYREFDGARRQWVSYSWTEIERRVAQWRRALLAEGLSFGERVAVLIANSVAHVCIDQAALSLGCVPVPLHVIDNAENLAYLLEDSGAAFLMLDSAVRWDVLAPLAGRLRHLRRVVYLRGSPGQPDGLARSLQDWLAAGAEAQPDAAPTPLSARSLAAIVYTSGTTGRPKGVMLSHANVLANVYAVLDAVPVSESDLLLSFLPLSHTLERTVGYYLPIAAGATVAFARSVPQLAEDLQTLQPTALISVPRIYERAYARLQESFAGRHLARILFAWTVKLGWQRFNHARGTAAAPAAWARVLWPLLDRAVAQRVRGSFGGRMRVAVTGGAPMPLAVARPFLACGLPLLQGYGMTESAPVVACNRPASNDPESVGPPLAGVEVQLGAEDELLVRGPSVMLGYWQRPEDTARALEGGWLHTGDQARIVDGRIYIKGRLKDIIVTSTGEKIAPLDLEEAILADPVFEQVMVIGEARPFVAALVVLNHEHWMSEARRLGLTPEDPASLGADSALKWALGRISAAVRHLPGYAQPREVALSLAPWTVADGLLTPTLKPKRAAIEQRFARQIAALYAGH